MVPVLLDDGEPLKVQGFATVYGPSASVECGIETICPGAFASFLASGAPGVTATWAHDRLFTWASVADGTLRLWESPVGLMFEAMIEASMRGRGLADFIAQGQAVASITFEPLECVETAGSREVVRANLVEMCIFHEAAFPTAVWLEHAPSETLALRHRNLRARWTR